MMHRLVAAVIRHTSSHHFHGPTAIHSSTFNKSYWGRAYCHGEQICCSPMRTAVHCTKFSNYWKSCATMRTKAVKPIWPTFVCMWKMLRCPPNIHRYFPSTTVWYCRRPICGNKMHKTLNETQIFCPPFFIITWVCNLFELFSFVASYFNLSCLHFPEFTKVEGIHCGNVIWNVAARFGC